MDEKNLKAIQRIMKSFSPADFDELVEIAKQEKELLVQKLKEERERDAAKILLSNLDTLLKNKGALPPDFVKELEKLSGHDGGSSRNEELPREVVIEKKTTPDEPKRISQAA